MTRVFITGLLGFTGAHMAVSLDKEGYEVGGCDLSVPETACWEALADGTEWVHRPIVYRGWVEQPGFMNDCVRAFEPDIVVHLAARSTVEVAHEDPLGAFETNVLGTIQVLAACREHETPVIVASSDKAYGKNRAPFFEDETPLRPMFPYDISKAAEDLVALGFFHSYKMNVAVTRSCNIYGPGDLHWNRLVPRSFRELATNGRPVIYGAMQGIRREWVYVSDVVAAYRIMIEKLLKDPEQLAGVAVNIGTGYVLTLKEMMQRILTIAGQRTLEPIISQAAFPELGDEWLNHARLDRLGWKAKVKLDDGLRTSWEWYKAYFGGRT